MYEQLEAKYFSNGLKPTIQNLLESFNDYRAEIDAQIELRKEQMTTLGRGMKALTFVLGAIGFGIAQFIGPPASLLYATLTTVCFTEGISLKSMFSKTFNPVMGAASKVGDVVKNNKWVIINTLGIGVIGAMISVPIAGMLTPFFGPMLGVAAAGGITFAMMATTMMSGFITRSREKEANRKIDDLYYSLAQMTYQLYKILDREKSRFDKMARIDERFDFSEDLQYLKGKFDEYYAIWKWNHRGEYWAGYWAQEGTTRIKTVSAKEGRTYEWFLDRFLEAYEKAHGTRDDETAKFFKDYKYFMKFVKDQAYKNLRAPIKTRVALFESLVDIFPKFWGVPFSHHRLAKMIFTKDTASAFLSKGLIDKRIDFTKLLEIDYNTYKLTEAHFEALRLKISSKQLEALKSKVSQLIKEFIFSNPFDKPYINKIDIESSEVYTDSKYALYRGLYFLESENKGKTITLQDLANTIGTSVLSPGRFLAEGRMLSKYRDPYINIRSYILSQPKSHLRDITYEAFELHSLSLESYLPLLVGTYTHKPIELLIMLSLKSHGFTKGIKDEKFVGNLGKKVDLYIPLSATFLTVIGALSKIIPKGIKQVVVDFTHEAKKLKLKDYNFIKKYFKEYQSKDRFLFIVLTHSSITQADVDQLTKDIDRKYPQFAKNVKLILLEDFLNTLKVQEKVKSKIEELYDLVKDCLQVYDVDLRDESLAKLKDIYEQAKLFLKFPLSQLKLVQLKGSFFNLG